MIDQFFCIRTVIFYFLSKISMFSKFVCLTFNIEIEVSDVEDDSMENNSIYNQTNNYEDTIHEDGEENIVLFTEQKKPSKQSGGTL